MHGSAYLAVKVLKEFCDVWECNWVVRERLVAIGKVHVDVQSIAGDAPSAKCVRCGVQLCAKKML